MMYGHAAPPLPNLPAPPPPSNRQHHRYSSGSHSFSSASVVTVKRSSSGSRGIPMASQSPGDWVSREGDVHHDTSHGRRKSVAGHGSEYGSVGAISDVDGTDRWSLSSGSSLTSPGKVRRSRASSGAVIVNPADHQTSPQKRTSISRQPIPTSNTSESRQTQFSPKPTSERERRPASKNDFTALPPLHATPALTDSNDESPSTVQTIATPPISGLHPYEYFGLKDNRSLSSEKPPISRNHTAPIVSPTWSQQPHSDMSPVAIARARTAERFDHVRPSTPHDTHTNGRPRARDGQEKDKKAMLSKALQKANTAVLLDNAQNFEGALRAYSDACRLLQQVMERSSAPEDRRKLEAIRVTYTNRIDELRQLETEQDTSSDDKSLPERPMSDDGSDSKSKHLANVGREEYRSSFFTETMHAVKNSMNGLEDASAEASRTGGDAAVSKPVHTKSPPIAQSDMLQPPKTHAQYMPAPLSPRKSPASDQGDETTHWEPLPAPAPAPQLPKAHSASQMNGTPTSWLHTEDESPSASRASSVHSVSSQTGLRRKHIRGTSGGTDPDFDAAFDAAVEAAYDEGFEPDLEMRRKRATMDRQATATATGAGFSALNIERRPRETLGGDSEDEEEERILAELTSDLSFSQSFNFDAGSKSALPRQSDSSGYSRSTWQSSQASVDRATATTSLSTVAEDRMLPRSLEKASDAHLSANSFRRDSSHFPASAPPPTSSLPPLPKGLPTSSARQSTVRSRRLSGHNAKNLKIETSTETRRRASTMHNSPSPRHLELEKTGLEEESGTVPPPDSATSESQHEQSLRSPPVLNIRANSADPEQLRITTTLDQTVETPEDESASSLSSRPLLFRKNKSSMSLRAEHTLLLSPTNDSAPSLITPLSATFMNMQANRANDPRDSQRAKFSSIDAGLHSPPSHAVGADIFLFDTTLSSTAPASSPRSPGQPPQPAPLEPCPESVLLRPFWLMRALASTITHPYGGFLTTRLFVSREVWQTKGVKLKAVEDKIAQCDFLTAALGRLHGVDSYDADAIMDELQGFEEVMEKVQTALSKKLGNDVGVQGAAGMFKDAAMGAVPGSGGHGSYDADATAGAEKTKSKEGKGYLTSWRKLRSKSSNVQLSTANTRKTSDHKDHPTMPTVPMTAFVPVERRGHKREARNMAFEGPNREYMSSLARLLERAQVLDHIARQVEDPGLKHSSPTHVGLELSVRHAAEFFGFFVCRFILADLGILLEKFVKRGAEWVLA